MDQSDMLEDLRRIYAQDPEAKLLQIARRSLANPVNPEGANGTFRPHPLLVLLSVIGAVVVSVSFYFTYFQP